MAPTEAPKTRSARMPRRMSSSSMPTWTAPRLPPPARTKAVRRGAGPCRPSAACRRCAQRARRRSDQRGAAPLRRWPAASVTVSARGRRSGGRCAAASWRCRHASRPGEIVAHRPHDDDHDQHDHGDDEDRRRSRRRRRPWRAPSGRGRVPCSCQGRGMSHPVGTLRRWSSSPHARCSGPLPRAPRRRIEAAGGRCSRCCGATRWRGRASTPTWPAACGPGSRTPPTASVAARGDDAPRALPRAAPGARLGRGHGATTRGSRTSSSSRVSCTPLFRQLVARRGRRRPVGRRARRAAGARRRRRGAPRRVAARRGAGRAVGDGGARTPRNLDGPGPAVRPGLDAPHRRPRRHPAGRWPGRAARDLRPAGRACRSPAPRRCARSGSRRADRGRASGGPCTSSRCSRRCAAGRPRSAWRCSSRPPAATASRTCARSTSGPSPRTSPRG